MICCLALIDLFQGFVLVFDLKSTYFSKLYEIFILKYVFANMHLSKNGVLNNPERSRKRLD